MKKRHKKKIQRKKVNKDDNKSEETVDIAAWRMNLEAQKEICKNESIIKA